MNYAVAGSKCVGDDGKLKDENTSNCDTYGRLYNWATAMAMDASCNSNSCASQVGAKHRGICPSGWHIPNADDWNKLVNYVESSNDCSNCAARYLKATKGWNDGKSGNGSDKYGFSALPGGGGGDGGTLSNVGYSGFWWSASENNRNYAYYRYMGDSEDVYDVNDDKSILVSVRCVKD